MSLHYTSMCGIIVEAKEKKAVSGTGDVNEINRLSAGQVIQTKVFLFVSTCEKVTGTRMVVVKPYKVRL